MEKERASHSVDFFAYACARGAARFTPLSITAGCAALALVIVLFLRLGNTPEEQLPTSTLFAPVATSSDLSLGIDATTTDPLSSLGDQVMGSLVSAYFDMQSSGQYSSSTARAAAESLAPYIQAPLAYDAFTSADISISEDTSYARMLEYRSDLRESLAPLLKNTQPEYEIFAQYVDTHDPQYLQALTDVAENYRAAASSTVKVAVPKDAVIYHLAILNSMEEFAVTLDQMSTHADDPFASVALLRSYNQAESDVLTSFNMLANYYKTHAQ